MSDEQVVARKARRTADEIEQIVSEFQSSGLNRMFSASVRNPGTKASSNSGFKEDER
jgi:hypothetical protein